MLSGKLISRVAAIGTLTLIVPACNFFSTEVGARSDTGTPLTDVGTDRDTDEPTTRDLGADPPVEPPADLGPGETGASDDGSPDFDDASDMAMMPVEMWTDISAGDDHTCALDRSGRAFCWGLGANGRLGNGSERTETVPREVLGAPVFASIAAGGEHTCALDPEGQVWCWGHGGHIGSPSGEDQFVPFQPNAGTYERLELGHDAVCAVDVDDYVKCWGENDWGQLGVPDAVDRVMPIDLGGEPFQALDVSLGNEITCALDMNGAAICYGRDLDSAVDEGDAFLTQPIAAAEPFVDIEAGEEHACARTADDTVHCWGDSGLVDALTITGSATNAGLLVTDRAFESIDSGDGFSCGLDDGTMYCWGSNYRGQQGKGTDNSGYDPEPVSQTATDAKYRTFSLGRRHGCGITTTDELLCWGRGFDGKIGNGVLGWAREPVEVESTESFVAVAGGEYHTCGVTSDEKVLCWGRGSYLALGLGNLDHQLFPTAIPDLAVSSIGAVSSQNWALTAAGEAWVWGEEYQQVLGNGSAGSTLVPEEVDTTGLFTSFSLGHRHGCGVLTTGETVCWGDDERVGFSTSSNVSSPTEIGTMDHPTYVKIAAGWNHTCGLDDTGAAHCFGVNWAGHLGDGTRDDSPTVSVPVASTSTFTSITVGYDWSCAIDTNDDAYCWGQGNRAGDGGGSSDELVPVLVSGGHEWANLQASRHHTCGTTVNGEVYCWGGGDHGRLGNGNDESRNTPQRVVLSEPAVHAAAMGDHGCAVGVSGTAYCWGSQEFGRLGDGIDSIQREPVPVDTSEITEP